MKHTTRYFCWSDNWWIEENNAWFVDGERDILFKMDLSTNQGEFIARLPNDLDLKFRQNSRCIKYKNDIICMPYLGKYIWIYHMNKFEKITIENSTGMNILINNFWQFENKLFAISIGLKQIIEINIEQRKIDSYYSLNDRDIQIAGSIKVENKIFLVSAVSNQIYEFDLKTKKWIEYGLKSIQDKLYAICFDGSKFWLSGYNKAVYLWDKERNSVEIIKDFPESFGIYDYTGNNKDLLDYETTVYDTPVFIDIKFLGKYIWFIPFKTNKIIYINKDTFEISNLNMINEYETKDTLIRNHMAHKYLVLYIREDRYIGLFSFKNWNVFEIDTLNLQIENKRYFFSSQCLTEISKYIICNEYNYFDKEIYQNALLMNNISIIGSQFKNIGLRIYESFITDN